MALWAVKVQSLLQILCVFSRRRILVAYGAVVAQEEEQSPTNRKVGGSTPASGPHIEVSLGKTLNPTLPTDASIGV